jgi:hypothetical protein
VKASLFQGFTRFCPARVAKGSSSYDVATMMRSAITVDL